jgi:formate C-acetyltransferase
MPSGRRHGDMLAASLQPSPQGRRGAPTELLSSVAAIDFRDFAGGVSNVQEMDPTHFRGEQGLETLVGLIKGFWAQGGMELSLNMIGEETLCEARSNPGEYDHLMVRLFGLSARFVCLEDDLQQVIIDRVAAAGRAG